MRGAICLKAACGAANLSPFRLIHTEPAVNSRLIKPYISSAMEEKTVGFQGIQGAYSESAAEGLFRSSQHLKHVRPIFKGYQTFNQTFEALKKREIDYAIIPIENSSTGTFLWNFDLMHNFDAHIVGEYCIHESHCLVALPGVKIEDLKEIRSHPYVIDQCQLFLSDAGKHLSVSQALDTAGSASYIKEKNLKDVGAIAGKKAAEIYGLSILKENVEDKQNTITRYILLSNEAIKPGRHLDPKTSVSIWLKNQPGAFYKALSCFALRDINLVKIESRPSSRSITLAKAWEYVLYLDFDGSTNEETVKNALNHLGEFAMKVRIFGSYPKFHANEQINFLRGGM